MLEDNLFLDNLAAFAAYDALRTDTGNDGRGNQKHEMAFPNICSFA